LSAIVTQSLFGRYAMTIVPIVLAEQECAVGAGGHIVRGNVFPASGTIGEIDRIEATV
jgi:hypothetical protein